MWQRHLPKKGRLEYIDRRTGVKSVLVMSDFFINWRTEEPAKNSSYDTHLYKLCDEADINRFCMHALRHTYATRAIERGMLPKVLQKFLEHASIQTIVHVTNDSLTKAVLQFGESSPRKVGAKWCKMVYAEALAAPKTSINKGFLRR